MKVVVVSIYEAIPLYKLFEDCHYTHVDDMCYFFVPKYEYELHADKIPRHALTDYPYDPETSDFTVINEIAKIPKLGKPLFIG